MTNLDIWNRLSRTDPKHTKGFKRAGGFSGTAVKPIYTIQKMTEEFGPVGEGWGYTEPKFQLVNGPEGEVAVYCWLSLWYRRDGVMSEPIPGIGGDFAVAKNQYGLRVDDEAFKKAVTDALGNAMKHLGMSADVHMGQFEGSKYVGPVRDEPTPSDSTWTNKPRPPMKREDIKAATAAKNAPTLEFEKELKGVESLSELKELEDKWADRIRGDTQTAWLLSEMASKKREALKEGEPDEPDADGVLPEREVDPNEVTAENLIKGLDACKMKATLDSLMRSDVFTARVASLPPLLKAKVRSHAEIALKRLKAAPYGRDAGGRPLDLIADAG